MSVIYPATCPHALDHGFFTPGNYVVDTSWEPGDREGDHKPSQGAGRLSAVEPCGPGVPKKTGRGDRFSPRRLRSNESNSSMEYREQVAKLIDSLLAVPACRAELEYLQRRLSIPPQEIIDAWMFYDLSIMNYSNESYSSTSLRMAMHLHNQLAGNWHDRRQEIVLGYLETIAPEAVCDIGFGTPQRYVRHYLSTRRVEMALCEFESTSLEFAELVLEHWRPDWSSTIKLIEHDMNRDELPAGYPAYLFQDSIEHALQPTETLHRYVDSAWSGTYFLFSLPIEVADPIPGHHISWPEEAAALDWLGAAGLTVLDKEVIHFHADLDLHSHRLHPDTRQLAVLSVKK
ncbi:hypothetical protein IU483_00340 [Streptomyces gardneri]|nr:hypothetical protein [Streptomyces gardneri]